MSTVETVEQARKALSGMLVFGNLEQIRAVRFLQAVERCKKSISDCRETHIATSVCTYCDGGGRHECECGHEHDCGECGGDGDTAGSGIRWCVCVDIYSREVINAAIREMGQ